MGINVPGSGGGRQLRPAPAPAPRVGSPPRTGAGVVADRPLHGFSGPSQVQQVRQIPRNIARVNQSYVARQASDHAAAVQRFAGSHPEVQAAAISQALRSPANAEAQAILQHVIASLRTNSHLGLLPNLWHNVTSGLTQQPAWLTDARAVTGQKQLDRTARLYQTDSQYRQNVNRLVQTLASRYWSGMRSQGLLPPGAKAPQVVFDSRNRGAGAYTEGRTIHVSPELAYSATSASTPQGNWARQALVHEMAHTMQSPQALASGRATVEGGAQAFADAAAPRVIPGLRSTGDASYAGFVQGVRTNRGSGWYLRGQFDPTAPTPTRPVTSWLTRNFPGR